MLIFPNDQQNIEFIEDVTARLNEAECNQLATALWKYPLNKQDVKGIHSTLFYECGYKKEYYPNKYERDLNAFGRAWKHV